MTDESQASEKGRAIVVGMTGATGLAVVRALAHAGVRCLALNPDLTSPACATRLATCRRCPDWRGDAERFVEELVALGAEWAGDGPASVFVADDAALGPVWGARRRLAEAGLSPAFSFVHPPDEVVDKRTQIQAARRAGVDVPDTTWGSGDELLAGAGGVALPVLVKPAISHAGVKTIGGKAISCESLDQVRAALERTREIDVMLQDFVPGGDDRLYTAGVFRGGGRTLVFTGRKLKQHPPTLGISRLSEALEVPELVAGSVRLLEELGYEGIAQVEYKQDERDGVYRLMEVNFRPWTWIGLATKCGVPLIVAAHEWALGSASPLAAASEPAEPALQQSSGRWVWVVPEVIHTMRGLAHGERPALRQWRHVTAEAFYSRDDSTPFVRTLTAPFDRRILRAKRLVQRSLRPPAFLINSVYLPAAVRREAPVAPPVVGLPPGDRLLVLAPHPDDETIMCGATVAASRRRGDAVRIVGITSGTATNVGVRSDDVGGARLRELRAAARELGVADVVAWDLPDRGVMAQRAHLATVIGEQLREYAPTDVYVPFPFDSHADHVATALALADALASAPASAPSPAVHCGFIQTPPSIAWVNRVVPSGGNWAAKKRAIAAYQSRDRAIFAKPLQLARLWPGHRLRAVETFVDLSARAYVRLCHTLDDEKLVRPSTRSPWHPLLLSLDLERTRGARARIAVTLKETADQVDGA